MTLTAAGLAAAMKAEQGASQDETIQDEANLKVATAIINYLVANTVVSVIVTGGTGTGTIS
jgi:molybdopterin biosynthesis enzyme MoaB